jgi:hypothetical protein
VSRGVEPIQTRNRDGNNAPVSNRRLGLRREPRGQNCKRPRETRCELGKPEIIALNESHKAT